MSRGSRIIAIGGNDGHSAQTEAEAVAETALPDFTGDHEEDWVEAAPAARSYGWLPPALAFLAIVGWTALYGWSLRGDILSGGTASAWSGWITGWSGPVLLVGVAWLLAMRSSTREAARFGDAARMLSEEAAQLEERLITVNRELSLAREFIAAQSRDLEALGRIAADRLAQDADRLQSLIRSNGDQVEAIGTVSTSALDNMERLRGQLPVIASSAKDVTNNIANAGRAAHAHLQELVSGFRKLNEFGQASERQVVSLREQVGETLTEFSRQTESLEAITSARFAALAAQGADFRTGLEQQEIEALAAIRSRASALAAELEEARGACAVHEADALAAIRTRAATLTEELDATRLLLERQEEESLTSLRARLSAVRDEGSQLGRAMQEAEQRAVAAWRGRLEGMQADIATALETLGETDAKAMQAAKARLVALVQEAERFETGLAERNRQFDEQAERRRLEQADRETSAMADFRTAFAGLDAELESRAKAQRELAAAFASHAARVAIQLEQLDQKLQDVVLHGGEAEAKVSEGIAALAEKLLASREALAGTDRQIAELTDGSVRLLELIQASVQHSRTDLPAALNSGEESLAALESRIFALRDAMGDADGKGESLSAYVLSTNDSLAKATSHLNHLHDGLAGRAAEYGKNLAELNRELEGLSEKSASLAGQAREDLTAAIASLSGAAHEAAREVSLLSRESIASVAARLGEESGAAIEREVRSRAAEVAGKLEQAAAHAAGVSREAAIQLRDQLAKVNELAGNLERRVAQARERAEEQVDNDFARRVALITDSLNSNAIDIAKALSSDVSDTAWAAYLRGDRGIFTRRAVSLIDSSEARNIAQLFENDFEFREHVSRYIHDFEAMLRQLLATRDGHALGVTLLSSDMGKLYVALAQGIERLRG